MTADAPTTASSIADTSSEDLGAPLYAAWQLTNECNLACLHCIEQSGPGKAFPDEVGRAEIFDILAQLMDRDVPYVSFSGGEPMIHPLFFEMADYVCKRNGQLKIETNGHYLTPDNCTRLKELDVKAVQVSMDGVSSTTFNRMRVRGNFDLMVEGVRNLGTAGVPIEINYSPTRFNVHEIARAVDFAYELGAYSFYTGRTMYTGNAVKTWHLVAPSDEQYAEYFAILHQKSKEYEGRMRVYFHEMGLLEELRYRLVHPAALFIILPNGLVKLINALPFVCGDLRKQSLDEVWARFQAAWHDPRVAEFIEHMAVDPGKTSELHDWVYL